MLGDEQIHLWRQFHESKSIAVLQKKDKKEQRHDTTGSGLTVEGKNNTAGAN
jgi:hypothetical protein